MNAARHVFAALLGAAIFFSAGCAKKETVAGSATVATPAAAGPKDYALSGEVVALSKERGTVIAKHDEIPGYMPAMTMEFTFDAADAPKLTEGRRFRARLIDDRQGNLHLKAVEPVDARKESEINAAALALRQDTATRGKGVYREIGEDAPRFTLYNQDGEVVSADRLRGRRIVLNFIYTRCPIATMCPAATQRMHDLQLAAHKEGVANLQLISISLDPAYDTPSVLKEYAAARGIDTKDFNFLTGPEGAVRDLLMQFGVIVEPGENFLKHTLSTLLIDERGRIVHRVDGTQWKPAEFLDKLGTRKS